jgi:hypothetical protein
MLASEMVVGETKVRLVKPLIMPNLTLGPIGAIGTPRRVSCNGDGEVISISITFLSNGFNWSFSSNGSPDDGMIPDFSYFEILRPIKDVDGYYKEPITGFSTNSCNWDKGLNLLW